MKLKNEKRPTHGLERPERLAIYRDNLIVALVRRMERVRRDLECKTPPKGETREFVRRKTARMVSEIRRVSQEIGPVRPVTRNIRNHD